MILPLLLALAAPDRAAVEEIVRAYILEHPEIIPQAMERLQARDTAKAIADNRAAIETPFANAWEGARDADVTIVEFFDYACTYCRASLPDIDRLLRADPKLRIVYREFPVLGPDSEAASLAALGAAAGARYGEFHRALYASALDAGTLKRLSERYGVTASAEAAKEIAKNRALARPLGLTGTPSWVVGDRILSGAVGYDALRAAVAEARAKDAKPSR